jgi:putative ABC transport system ATP-binding protein
MRLEISGLVHRFAGLAGEAAPAVEIGTLEIEPGVLTVLTGPSGSGKSTLLYLMSGILKPGQGEIRWDGTDLAAAGESVRDRWRRTHAGFVFQDFHLIAGMTALANVTVAAYFAGFSDRHVRPRGVELLKRFGVPVERRPAASYSRGEQQRIAVARALIFDPRVIFADEPTASLDAANADEIATLFAALAAEGRTVIAVSHDAALIGRAGKTVALERGRLPGKTRSQAA